MIPFAKKKIALIYCGGLNNTASFNAVDLKKWLEKSFELTMMADITPFFLGNYSGADIKWDLASEITCLIKNQYTKYSGFIIIHSLDNILFTSCLTSFMIQNPSKPIIFSCDRLLKNKDDKLAVDPSILNAVQIATMPMGNVGLVLGNHLVKAVHAQFSWQVGTNFLASLHANSLAKIQFGISMNINSNKKKQEKIIFNTKYNSNIEIIDCYPGKEFPKISENVQGIFIKGYQDKIISSNWQLPKNIPVCVYSTNRHKIARNVIRVTDLTHETAIAKFIWALGQSKEISVLQKIMSSNLTGEY